MQHENLLMMRTSPGPVLRVSHVTLKDSCRQDQIMNNTRGEKTKQPIQQPTSQQTPYEQQFLTSS